MDAQSGKLKNIYSLTSVRIFCTLLVVVHHLDLERYTNNAIIAFIDKYILHTGRGIVSFFFFLSGFIICYSSREWGGWKPYMIRRFSRVYPNHWIITLTIAGFTLVIPLLSGENLYYYLYKLVLNFSLIQSFVPDKAVNFSFNGVAWTLSLEVFFYLIFLLIRPLSTKNIFMIFLTLYSTKLFLETIWFLAGIDEYAHWLFFMLPIFRLPEFLLGVVMCRIYFLDSKAFSWFKIDPFVIIVLNIAITGTCRYHFNGNAIYLYSTLPSLLGFLLLLACLGIENSKEKYFNNKVFLFLGEAAFSIYLIHQPIFNAGRKLVSSVGHSMSVSLMLLFMVFSLIVAVGYFFYIERRVYKWSVKYLSTLVSHPQQERAKMAA